MQGDCKALRRINSILSFFIYFLQSYGDGRNRTDGAKSLFGLLCKINSVKRTFRRRKEQVKCPL